MTQDQSARHRAILAGLDHNDPESIRRLIDFHRSTFGGFAMTVPAFGVPAGGNVGGVSNGTFGGSAATGTTPLVITAPPSGQQPTGGQQQDGDADELGAGGKQALKSERDARKALEKQVADLTAAQTAQMARLAEAFGLTPQNGGAPNADDVVSGLQDRIGALEHSTLVYQLVAQHGITDQADIDLLMGTQGGEAVGKLAARLAPKDQAGGSAAPRKRPPQPDPSQGHSGGGHQPSAKDQGLAEARRRWPETASATK